MPLNISDIKHKQQYDTIADPIQLKLFLKRLHENRVLLSASISGDSRIFNSIIIGIDYEKQQVHIDKLHPDEGHDLLIEAGKITVFAGLDGIDLSFVCELAEVNDQEGIPFYTLSFPGHIKHYQKRSSYRVKIIRSLTIPVQLVCKDGETYNGELDNISTGGMRVRFKKRFPKQVEKDLLIPRCEINLPDEGPMLCAVEVRHVANGEKGNLSYLGLQFDSLNAVDQRTINRFVTSLERELRRRRPS